DQEQFQRVKAKAGGKPTQTYHGLYASHPRNDQRLRTVVREAGQLDQETFIEDPSSPGEFRRRLEGLVWGESVQGEQAENRYYHTKLDFTFEHPPGWKVNAGSSTIIATALDGSADMTLSLKGRKPEDTPKSVLESNAGGELRDGEKLEQAGLIGYTAVSSKDGESHRLAVIQYKNLFYLFDGKASDFPATDAELLALVESFRPIHPRERRAANPRRIEYIQVPRGATLSSLAASMRIPDAEAQLRLINGFYPRGEPRTGDWIKIIR
ncbi:MAG: peptidase M48, partial [Pseudomonadota bacterium]